MGRHDEDVEMSVEQRRFQRQVAMYKLETRARQEFMQDLRRHRRDSDRGRVKALVRQIGAKWFQILSQKQKDILPLLADYIHQDRMSGAPKRVAELFKVLGVYKLPKSQVIMMCMYDSETPVEFMANVYQAVYMYPYDTEMKAYDLNARLILTSIYQLELEEVIEKLTDIFRNDEDIPVKQPVQKCITAKDSPSKSPYLMPTVARIYYNKRTLRKKPLPLPDLHKINDMNEPPPQPKKDLVSMMLHAPKNGNTNKSPQYDNEPKKKSFGMTKAKKITKPKRPPLASLEQEQNHIIGVAVLNYKCYYILGPVVIQPPAGELINGGLVPVGGESVVLNLGMAAPPAEPPQPRCTCMQRWQDVVFHYVKRTKCYCGHHYDFGEEGTFPKDELPFFYRPTRHSPFVFDYEAIYNMDPKSRFINKTVRDIWETDSMLNDDACVQKVKPAKIKLQSRACLSERPRLQDYLWCALRLLKAAGGVAARLPDMHLMPDLLEWMRYRIYGPLTRRQREMVVRKCHSQTELVSLLCRKGLGRIYTKFVGDDINICKNWLYKNRLRSKFDQVIRQYRVDLYRAQAVVNNYYWAALNQAQMPNKKFREIYFSYLFGSVGDLCLLRPYDLRESLDRWSEMDKKKIVCFKADRAKALDN